MARPKSSIQAALQASPQPLQDVSSLAGTSTPVSKSLSPQDTPI